MILRLSALLYGLTLSILLVACLPPTPTPTPTATPSPTPTPTATPSPTPECRRNNLINCGVPVPVYDSVTNNSTASATLINGKLKVDFDNKGATSGVAFQFAPSLIVTDFNFVEVSGTSTKEISFRLEYKVRTGGTLDNAKTSVNQKFPATSVMATIKVPLAYEGAIDELVINFFETGESSAFTIESIRLE